MGFTAQRLNDEEPIVVFTYYGMLTVEIFREVIQANARFVREIGEPIYIIADVRQLETTLLDMIQVMQEATQEGEGSAKDENIKMLIFVGSSAFAKMYRDTMQKRKAVFGMTMFEDMDQAIEAARFDKTKNQGLSVS